MKASPLLGETAFKMTVVHELQPCDAANKVNFCTQILQSVHDGEISPHIKAKSLKIKPSRN
jgi:hypothetical protein